jgi:TolB-like protein
VVIRAAVILTTLLFSCAYWKVPSYLIYPKNPFPDIKTVAIFPFINYSGQKISGEEFASKFASELSKFEGFRTITPAQIKSIVTTQPSTLDEALETAQRLKADAIILGAIKNYNPYYPPSIVVFVEVISMRRYKPPKPRDIDILIQSASWEKAPVRITKKQEAEYLICSFEKNYDTREPWVRNELKAYAMTRYRGAAFENEQEFLNVQERFWEFVCNMLIREIIKYGKAKPD